MNILLLAVMSTFVGVSEVDSNYFQTREGKTWVPVGCNICFERMGLSNDEARAKFDEWMTAFAANGGNFMRVWLSLPFTDIMPAKAYEFNPVAEANLKWMVSRAEELGLRLKFTLEHFRGMKDVKTEFKQGLPGVISFQKPLYAPYARTVKDFFKSAECFDIYMAKARRMKELGLGDSPAVIAWETWNEINSVGCATEDWFSWSVKANAALRELFPNQMILTNLGSFSSAGAFSAYDALAKLPVNDYLQAHRYFDPGAELDVCRGPMDVLCAETIRELRTRRPQGGPVILAETGAVERNHRIFSHRYELDKDGMLLHDEIFAAFFAGSAGTGQPWHWDHQYVSQHNLWWHFARFAKAIEGLDPAAEHFRPFRTETHRMRIWGLKGVKTTVGWCRDKSNTWETEIETGRKPLPLVGEQLPKPVVGKAVCDGKAEVLWYHPWEDRTETSASRDVPAFTRSIVFRVEGTVGLTGVSR